MAQTRKISLPRVFRFIVGSMIVISFFVLVASTSKHQKMQMIKDVEIHLNDHGEYVFLNKKDIEMMIVKSLEKDLLHSKVAELDLTKLKEKVASNPWVKSTQVYIDNRNVLQVKIEQRIPVARVFMKGGADFYLDESNYNMPTAIGKNYSVPVFTNVPQDNSNQNIYPQIAYLGNKIKKDSFWNAQITQIDMTENGEFVLVPLVGKQTIYFGDTNRTDIKLTYLIAFYKNVLNKIGWESYETIDLRFKGQIVTTPALGWKPPKTIDTTMIDYRAMLERENNMLQTEEGRENYNRETKDN